jgi:hypothetical protein
MKKIIKVIFPIVIFLLSCTSGGQTHQGNELLSTSQLPQRQSVQQLQQNQVDLPITARYWIGDGGREIRLAILEPIGREIPETEKWILSLIQSSITADFNRYSDITVIDRQNLDRILGEQELSLSGMFSDDDYVSIGNLTNTQYILTGSVTRTGSIYILELSVTDLVTGVRRVSYGPQNVSLLAMQNMSAIRDASADMLGQLGVQLTERGLAQLRSEANTSHIQAETALARGINAQRHGTEVAALSYFFQAVAFEPAMVEAVNRSSILAANIRTGNIGDDARNEIQWFNDWVARLRETEQFFNNYFNEFFRNLPPMPYVLYYTSDDIRRIGEVNVRAGTLTLGTVETLLSSSDEWLKSIEPVFQSMQSSVQAVLDGLSATRRARSWGLDNWPQQGAFNIQHFTRRNENFLIEIELLNSRNQVIGRNSFRAEAAYEFPVPLPGRGEQRILISWNSINSVIFSNVRADDITDNLTIRIARVNNIPAETAARDGILQVQAVTQAVLRTQAALGDISKYIPTPASDFRINNRGVITGFTGRQTIIIIPSSINGVTVTAIGDRVFNDKGLANIIIPDGVTSIGNSAFFGNRLTSVTIPNSVNSIGWGSFSNNQLSSITIGTSVRMNNDPFGPFPDTFIELYNSIGRLAGVYTSADQHGFRWSYRPLTPAYNGWIFANGIIFDYTGNDTSLVIPSEINGIRVTSIGMNAFGREPRGRNADRPINNITIPNGVVSIGESAFIFNRLASITIPKSVTNIGASAFMGNRLRNLIIPNNVISIGNDAFASNQLISVTISNSVTSIGHNAFRNNSELTRIVISANVTIEETPDFLRDIVNDTSNYSSFPEFYNGNGKRAGVYTFRNGKWNYSRR